MRIMECEFRAAALVAAGALVLSLALPPGAARAQQPYVMKISTPTIHDIPDHMGGQGSARRWRKIPAAGSRRRFIRRASSARSRGRSKAPNSARSRWKLCRRNSWSGSIPVLRLWPPRHWWIRRRTVSASPPIPSVLKLMLGLGADKGTARRRPVHGRTVLNRVADAAAPSRGLQGQENPNLRLTISKRGIRAARRHAGGHDARRRVACDSAGRHRRRRHRHRTDRQLSHGRRSEIRRRRPASRQYFIIAEVNQKWFDSLPKDLQQIIEQDAKAESLAINPFATSIGQGQSRRSTRRRRRVDQTAARRSGNDDEDHCERRPGRVEEESGTRRRIQDREGRSGTNGAIPDPVIRDRRPKHARARRNLSAITSY